MRKTFFYFILIPLVVTYMNCSCNHKNRELSTPRDEQKSFSLFLDSLDQLSVSENDKANEIRKYLAQRLNRDIPEDSISNYFSKAPYDSLQPFECLSLLKSGKLVGNCGLASFILAKLYRHAGYNVYIYDCGFESTKFTHQFTLVEIDNKLIVQDAHYNMTIVTGTGNPKDFMQMLSELGANDFRDINFEEGELIKGGKKVNFSFIAQKRLAMMMPLIKSEGLPESFLSIYLKPLYIIDARNGKNAVELNAKILAICRPN